MAFFDYIKNIFMLLLFLLFAPGIFEGIRTQYSAFMSQKTKAAVIKIRGELHHSGRLIKELHTFFTNSDIKAVLLDIESCGGASGTGQAVAQEILTLKKKYPKPIITLTENVCASGAYYIASATDYIISSGQALIGSIGSSIPMLFQLNGFLQKHDIGYESIRAGAYKGVTDPFLLLDEAGKAQLQAVVDDSYEQFVQDVAHNRKLSAQNASSWANGTLFTGKQAKSLGLVDELGASSQAVAYIKDKQLIAGDIEWVTAEPPRNFLQNFFYSDDTDDCGLLSSKIAGFTSIVKKVCSVKSRSRLE